MNKVVLKTIIYIQRHLYDTGDTWLKNLSAISAFSARHKRDKQMTENDISYQIRGAIYDVYKPLDPCLLPIGSPLSRAIAR